MQGPLSLFLETLSLSCQECPGAPLREREALTGCFLLAESCPLGALGCDLGFCHFCSCGLPSVSWQRRNHMHFIAALELIWAKLLHVSHFISSPLQPFCFSSLFLSSVLAANSEVSLVQHLSWSSWWVLWTTDDWQEINIKILLKSITLRSKWERTSQSFNLSSFCGIYICHWVRELVSVLEMKLCPAESLWQILQNDWWQPSASQWSQQRWLFTTGMIAANGFLKESWGVFAARDTTHSWLDAERVRAPVTNLMYLCLEMCYCIPCTRDSIVLLFYPHKQQWKLRRKIYEWNGRVLHTAIAGTG